MRRYRYVGPSEIARAAAARPAGRPVRSPDDLLSWMRESAEPPEADGAVVATFVVDVDGVLRVAPRRSEHVACAGGGDVLSAGELRLAVPGDGPGQPAVVAVSNQSTGYCPEPESYPAVAAALEAAGIALAGPAALADGFTREMVFRRCTSCGQRNIVKEGVFECSVCGAALDGEWNFG